MGTGPGILLAPFPYGLSSSFHPLSIPPSSARECRPSLSALLLSSAISLPLHFQNSDAFFRVDCEAASIECALTDGWEEGTQIGRLWRLSSLAEDHCTCTRQPEGGWVDGSTSASSLPIHFSLRKYLAVADKRSLPARPLNRRPPPHSVTPHFVLLVHCSRRI